MTQSLLALLTCWFCSQYGLSQWISLWHTQWHPSPPGNGITPGTVHVWTEIWHGQELLVQFVWPFIHTLLSVMHTTLLTTDLLLVHHITDCSAVKHSGGHYRLIENLLNAHTERHEHPQEVKFIIDFLVQHDCVVSPTITETHHSNSLSCWCGFPHIRNCRWLPHTMLLIIS